MLDQLVALSQRLGGELYGFLLPNDVRGVMIGVDDYWMEMYISSHFGPFSRCSDRKSFHLERMQYGWSVDETFRPEHWMDHCKKVGYPPDAQPFYIRVIVRDPKQLRSTNLPTQFAGYPLIYEYRPPCVALHGVQQFIGQTIQSVGDFFVPPSKVSIGRAKPDTAGTLGGVLRSPITGQMYVVSCAHVMGPVGTEVFSPGPYEGHGNSRKIGEVKVSQLAEQSLAARMCNPSRMSQAKKLDVSVAELTEDMVISPFPVGPVNHIRNIADMVPNDDVVFYGKVSGLTKAQIKHVCIWYEVEIEVGDNERVQHCFGDIFEIEQPRPRYVNSSLCRPGDSGAWILCQIGDIISWDGILFAGDGANGYCCFSEHVMDVSNAAIGELVLVP